MRPIEILPILRISRIPIDLNQNQLLPIELNMNQPHLIGLGRIPQTYQQLIQPPPQWNRRYRNPIGGERPTWAPN